MSSQNNADYRQSLMDQLQFLGQMASTETALFHQKAAEQFGLSITDMKTISTLMQEGSMTAGQLAKRLNLTSGAITSVIDRLEAVKLVKRHSDPTDRRKVIVILVPHNLKTGGEIYDSMGRSFEKLLSTYTTEQLEFLAEFYKASVKLTKGEIAKLGPKA